MRLSFPHPHYEVGMLEVPAFIVYWAWIGSKASTIASSLTGRDEYCNILRTRHSSDRFNIRAGYYNFTISASLFPAVGNGTVSYRRRIRRLPRLLRSLHSLLLSLHSLVRSLHSLPQQKVRSPRWDRHSFRAASSSEQIYLWFFGVSTTNSSHCCF